MIKKCLQCNNEFKVANWNKNKKFCSKKCTEDYLNINNRIKKVCAICNKEFMCSITSGKWKVTCSKECARKNVDKINNDSREVRKCLQCNKEFIVSKSIQKVCCSKECREKYINRFKIKVMCIICGKYSWISPSRQRPTCSRECGNIWESVQKMGENNPNFIGRVRNTYCIVCGNEFKDYMGNAKFCSLECKGKWQSENCCGENNAFYGHHHTEENRRFFSENNRKGLVESINRAIRDSNRYKEWRKAVYEKDNYTCQICNVRGGYLHAHHIKELSKLIEEYPNVEEKYESDPFALINDEYFWNIENGQCCHSKCHYNTYHIKNK